MGNVGLIIMDQSRLGMVSQADEEDESQLPLPGVPLSGGNREWDTASLLCGQTCASVFLNVHVLRS